MRAPSAKRRWQGQRWTTLLDRMEARMLENEPDVESAEGTPETPDATPEAAPDATPLTAAEAPVRRRATRKRVPRKKAPSSVAPKAAVAKKRVKAVAPRAEKKARPRPAPAVVKEDIQT